MHGHLKNLLILFHITLNLYLAQDPFNEENGRVKWLNFKEAQEKNKTFPKPFLIDIYTDWCGWCKVMMKTTYSNPGLAEYINQNFYPVKFNAEGKDTVEFNGKIYKPTSPLPRSPHELALFFLGTSLSYPSTVFMTNQFQYRLLSQGYLKEQELEPFLVFFTESAWRNVPFEEFNQLFRKTFHFTPYQPEFPPLPDNLKELNDKKKKIIILGAGFCLTGKMMDKTTFKDSTLKDALKNFQVFYFDLERNDTLKYNDTIYTRQPINNYPLHTLGLKLSLGRFSIPGLVIMDEKNRVLDMLNFYFSPAQIKPLLEYFGNNIYMTRSWKEFMENYSSLPASKSQSGKKNKK